MRRPLKRPYEGPPLLFLADPRKDPRISSACANIELDLRNFSARGSHAYIAWASVAELSATSKRSGSSVREHIGKLKQTRRIYDVRGIRNLRQWFLVHGAKFGLSFEKLHQAVAGKLPARGRFFILASRLPPIQDGYQWDSLYPLNLKEADDEPVPECQDSGTLECQDSGTLECQDSGGSAATLPIRSEELPGRIVVETPACEPPEGDDDESDDSVPEYLRPDLSLPQGHPRRKLAERMLRNIRIRVDGGQPNPAAPLAISPAPATVPAVASQEAPRARQGDRGRSQVEAIVRSVADGATGPQDGGAAVGEALGDAKPLSIRTYRAGLQALADGRASLPETLAIVADAFGPRMRWPERSLSQGLAEIARRVKKPDAGSTRQSCPASSPNPITPRHSL